MSLSYPIQIRTVVVLTVMCSLLLIPATCAHAAGPHSLFSDPLAHDHQHETSPKGHITDQEAMTPAELELHALLGHHSPTGVQSRDAEPASSLPTSASIDTHERVECESGGPTFRDLPATMAMAAVTNPVVIDDVAIIDVPSPTSPPAWDAAFPPATSPVPEDPPPKP